MKELQAERQKELQKLYVENTTQKVTGRNIDEMYTAKELNLKQLVQELKDMRRECDQLRNLNIKLVERTEKLQSIIDEEASAHTFYYDYPPKPDPSLEQKDEKGNKINSEQEKMRKMYEEQITTLKRNYEREYNEMITSFAGEHEEMAQMLSECTAEAVEIKNKYIELDVKFQEYYAKSSAHIQE